MKLYAHREKENVFVAAEQLTEENYERLAMETHGLIVEESDAFDATKVQHGINVPTPAGRKRLSQGMYVVNNDGHLFLAQPGEFEAEYERAPK